MGRLHRLPRDEAKAVVERLATDLEQRFHVEWNWDGDDVHFRRPGVSGNLHVGESEISLDVRLGLLLTPLKPVIEREIRAQLDKLAGTDSA